MYPHIRTYIGVPGHSSKIVQGLTGILPWWWLNKKQTCLQVHCKNVSSAIFSQTSLMRLSEGGVVSGLYIVTSLFPFYKIRWRDFLQALCIKPRSASHFPL